MGVPPGVVGSTKSGVSAVHVTWQENLVTLHFDRGINIQMASSNWPLRNFLPPGNGEKEAAGGARCLACTIRHVTHCLSTHIH